MVLLALSSPGLREQIAVLGQQQRPTAAQLFASLCGAVGGADRPPPPYPAEPSPTGSGQTYRISGKSELDALLAGNLGTPPPGSVIVLADGVYNEARWRHGGSGVGFAGTSAHPITWYSENQHGAEITATTSYWALRLQASDQHHRFIGLHLRDGPELFLSEANGTEFLHGRVSGTYGGGAWKWRGVDGGPTADGMLFAYNVVSTSNGGSNFGRLEGVYIGDGQYPQLLGTRQTNFVVRGNCIVDAPGGAIDVKANSSNGLIVDNLIVSTDHWSGGINALPGWHWLPASARATDPNMRSENNRISVVAHPSSSDRNAGSGLRVGGTWHSDGDVIFDCEASAIFVLAEADLSLTVTNLTALRNGKGAANRGSTGSISLTSSNNNVDVQGSLQLATGTPQSTTTTTTSAPTTTTAPPATTQPAADRSTSVRPQAPSPTTTAAASSSAATPKPRVAPTPASTDTNTVTSTVSTTANGPSVPGETTTTTGPPDLSTTEGSFEETTTTSPPGRDSDIDDALPPQESGDDGRGTSIALEEERAQAETPPDVLALVGEESRALSPAAIVLGLLAGGAVAATASSLGVRRRERRP